MKTEIISIKVDEDFESNLEYHCIAQSTLSTPKKLISMTPSKIEIISGPGPMEHVVTEYILLFVED